MRRYSRINISKFVIIVSEIKEQNINNEISCNEFGKVGIKWLIPRHSLVKLLHI